MVVFGHMHKELAYRNGLRKMIVVGPDNTIYLNGAIVPRVKRLIDEQDTGDRSFMNIETPLSAPPESSGTMRAFTTVEILDGRVDKIAETWVSVVGDKTTLKEEHVLFKSGN
ncbi:uncharacterized protein LOC132185242 [Corylus avellana]|uniref:uncharacterized protein LOC132162421 n=1 Tax=Corylus avellana TaxID=13451 RepID=UPI00286A57FD|nr:uncharacterized protein LOC132162421 [Corylus avellana]XP_059455025.1 uncharacterized protein LOC132185242 [Corylus avellana]